MDISDQEPLVLVHPTSVSTTPASTTHEQTDTTSPPNENNQTSKDRFLSARAKFEPKAVLPDTIEFGGRSFIPANWNMGRKKPVSVDLNRGISATDVIVLEDDEEQDVTHKAPSTTTLSRKHGQGTVTETPTPTATVTKTPTQITIDPTVPHQEDKAPSTTTTAHSTRGPQPTSVSKSPTPLFASDMYVFHAQNDSGDTGLNNIEAIPVEGNFPTTFNYTVSGLFLNECDRSKSQIVVKFLATLEKNNAKRRRARERERLSKGTVRKPKSNTNAAYAQSVSSARQAGVAGAEESETSRPLWKNSDTAFLFEGIPHLIMLNVLTSLENKLFADLMSNKAKKIPIKQKERTVSEGRARQYYFHWDLNFKRFHDITWKSPTEPDDDQRLQKLKLTATPPIQISRKHGIKWYHSEVVIPYSATYDLLFHRVCDLIAQHLELQDRCLEKEFDCFFAIEQQGYEQRHGSLFVNNIESLKKAEKLKAGGKNEDNTLISPIDVGFEFIMPLCLEGMTLRIAKYVNGICEDVVPVYIPFGCGVLLRADCYRGGRYGSNNSRRLVVTLFTKNLDWYESMVFCKDEDINAKDEVFTKLAESKDAMVLALRPMDLEPEEEQYHSGSQTLAKYKTKLMENYCTSAEYKRIISNNCGDMDKYKPYQKRDTLLTTSTLKYFFDVHPKWLVETASQRTARLNRVKKLKNPPLTTTQNAPLPTHQNLTYDANVGALNEETIHPNTATSTVPVHGEQRIFPDAVVSLDFSKGGGVSDEDDDGSEDGIKIDRRIYGV
jgi:hypothetical protein